MAIVGYDPRIVEWLRALGLDPEHTQRVIIDVPVYDIVRLYVTHIADEKEFDVRFAAGEFEVVTVDKAIEDGLIDVTSRDSSGFKRKAPARAK